MRAFRRSVALVVLLALAVTAVTPTGGSVLMVLLGFSLSAATLCPLLVLGLWWRRLTWPGVMAGFLAGGGITLTLVGVELAGVRLPAAGYPAILAVPVSFATMVVVSCCTPGRIPAGVDRMLARMHLPEEIAGPPVGRLSPSEDRSPFHRSPHGDGY